MELKKTKNKFDEIVKRFEAVGMIPGNDARWMIEAIKELRTGMKVARNVINTGADEGTEMERYREFFKYLAEKGYF